jgi:hypothetical protein
MQIVNKPPESEPVSGTPVGLTTSVVISAGAIEFWGALAGEGKLHARDTAINKTSGQYFISELEDIIRKYYGERRVKLTG